MNTRATHSSGLCTLWFTRSAAVTPSKRALPACAMSAKGTRTCNEPRLNSGL